MALSEQSFHDYIQNHLGVCADEYDSRTPLFSSGILDSFNLIALMTYIEHEAGFRINPAEVSLDNFDSVERMLRFVERRSGNGV